MIDRDQTIKRDQMELSLEDPLIRRRGNLRRRRQSRARWWFSQMRQAVEHARDWPPVPPRRMELDIPLLRTREN